MSRKPEQPIKLWGINWSTWVPWAVLGAVILVVIVGIFALTGGDDDKSTAESNLEDAINERMGVLEREREAFLKGTVVPLPESHPAEDCSDKADRPYYDGADLSGYASYLAKDDPNNCRQSFVDRVRRFAADTCTYQPLVYPADTAEFIGYLRSACAAAGNPIR